MAAGPAPTALRWLPVAAGLMLMGSGLSALVFQVLWVKQLSLVVGVEVHAIAIGVAAFFAGLALGGWWVGPLADRSAQPLRLYAALEAGIALLACLATRALAHSAALFSWLEAIVGPAAWLLPVALVMPACGADGRHAAGSCCGSSRRPRQPWGAPAAACMRPTRWAPSPARCSRPSC